ncbi:MAG: hypothetical protein Q8J93_11375 [Xanthomonadales bacterium]|nr:hypothetical protein [Xanthomonadales bacterium]
MKFIIFIPDHFFGSSWKRVGGWHPVMVPQPIQHKALLASALA